MRVAFVIFDGMTALDFVGVYDPVTRLQSMGILPGFSWSIRAWTETVTDDRGLRIVPDSVAELFESFDVVIVPGGFTIETIVSEAGTSFARLRYSGTHSGELFGVPATGKQVEYAGAALFQFRDGLISEVWVLGDIHGLLRQIREESDRD